MITEYMRENELLIGSTERVNFNIPKKLLKLSDLVRMRINPHLTRTEMFQRTLMQLVVENQQLVNQILEDNDLSVEGSKWMKK
ncbi:MAG: hypothetical protein Q7T91_00525 [Sulfuricurvum sp.]|nr:hypothetical protein [Sulfuricurvum sp.]